MLRFSRGDVMSELPKILTRGVSQIMPSADKLAELMANRKIKLYLGIDPTGNQLTLGHAVVLRKLQQFVEAGHEVILLIGNGTVKIGDPTGKDKTRPMMTDEQIEANFKTWREQASAILDFDKIEVVYNADWLDKLKFDDLVKLMAKFTVQQMLERDMFAERLKNNQPIFLHELIYPLLQGYDSVVLEVDLELGGNDQLFNMMVGRQLLGEMKNKEKFVLTTPLLIGTDGRKMGKSLHNFIPLNSSPEDLFGALMSIKDEVMREYFELLTDIPQTEIESLESQVKNGELNPMEMKKQLAKEITIWLHGTEAADSAQKHFEKTVQQAEIPSELPTLKLDNKTETLLDIVMKSKVVSSKSEARRLIEQGGVELNQRKIIDPWQILECQNGDVIRVGRRNYFEIQK